jgi:hypothetical protein
MTTTHHIGHVASAVRRPRPLVHGLAEPALGTLLFTLVCGAWLAFFVFVPFDFTLSHPR